MNRYELVIDGVPMTVEILSIAGTLATVSVNGVTLQVELPPGASVASARPSRHPPVLRAVPCTPARTAPDGGFAPAAPAVVPAAAPGPSAGGEPVLAPMPGSVVKVLVGVGDHVLPGAPVILMEAMKMENEIKAHVAGTVVEVKVQKGQDVGVNEPLVVIGAA